MDIRHRDSERNSDPPSTTVLPPLIQRLAWPPGKHPGVFATTNWEVEPRPDKGLVSSLYARVGRTP